MSTILDHVGSTPLLRLDRLRDWAGLPATTTILAKAENLNPGGSCKDRIALALLADAERDGLRPGGTVIEATSGNTGIALAQACAVKGYHLHIVCSEKVSDEKVRLVRAFGGTVHRTPNVPHGHPEHYTEVAPRLARDLGGHYLRQFENEANIAIHEHETGPEILAQVHAAGHELDAFVAGVGTGGTITGIGRHLRRASPATRIVLADPEGSILAAGGTAQPYKVEGIGDDAVPELFDTGLVDDAVTIGDRTAFRHALAAARLEGLLIGGSAGAHLAAAIETARRIGPHATVATVLPDTGRNYLSTFLDPAWCEANGFDGLHEEAPAAVPAASEVRPAQTAALEVAV